MKKSIFCLILLIISFFITGCNSKITNINGIEKSVFEIKEDAIYENVHYRVIKAEYLNEDEYDYEIENPNNIILAITFEIENNSKKEYSVHDVEALLNVDGKDINSYRFIREPEEINNKAYFINEGEVFSETDYYEIPSTYSNIKYKLIIDSNKDIEMNVNLD